MGIVIVLAVAALSWIIVRHGSCGDLDDVYDDLSEEELDRSENSVF